MNKEKTQVYEIRENGKVLEQQPTRAKAEASKRKLKAKGKDVRIYSVFQSIDKKVKTKPKAKPKTKTKPKVVWPSIDSPKFREGWYHLENGCILFVQISTENGPETDRRYMTPKEYEDFYSDGWVGYLDYCFVDPDMDGDGGLLPYKVGWTIQDVVKGEFGYGVSEYIDMDDPWELRDAVDGGDDEYARELISHIPKLRSSFTISRNKGLGKIGPESVFTRPIDEVNPDGWFVLSDGWVLHCFRSDMNDVFEEYDDDDEEWLELEGEGWVHGGIDCFLLGPNGQIDDPFYGYKGHWSLNDFVRENFDAEIVRYVVVDDPDELRDTISDVSGGKELVRIMREYPELFGHLL